MPRNEGNHQVPLPNLMDSHVPYLPRGESNVLVIVEVPHVEIQTILPARNFARTGARESISGELVRIAQSLHDYMEGASKHPMKSTCELPHPAGARPYLCVVHAGRGFQCQIP